MSTINLNTRGNSMPSGRKSIILFYEEMIDVAKNNIGCVTDFNTIIDEKFICVLENRLEQLNYQRRIK